MTRIAVCLLVACTFASAQPVLNQSLANDWSHVWGSPYWNDNIPTTESMYGVVDELSYVWWLEWFSPTITLPAGTYGCRVRIKKTVSAAGADVLTLSQNGTSNAVNLIASAQPVGQWVWTPDLVFTVPAGGGTVAFRLHNTGGNQKQNYWFDEFEIRQPDWSINKPEATSDVNGVTTNGFDKAVTSGCGGSTVSINFSSTEVGQPWDFGYSFAPSVPGSSTGIQTLSGQKLNVNILDPTFQYYQGGNFNIPYIGNFSLPVTIPTTGVASMQSAHIAPTHPDAIGLSQASQLDIQGGTPVPLALADDVFLLVPFQAAPYCSTMSGVTFYGTTYTSMYVSSNGEVQFVWPTSIPTPSVSQFKSWMPRVSAMWTNLSPNLGGTVSVIASATDLKVSFQNVQSQAVATTANSVDVTFTQAGATIIDSYSPDPGHPTNTLVGISRGSGSSDPGPMGGTTAGTIIGLMGLGLQVGAPADAIYQYTAGAAPLGGWNSLEFPTSDGSAFIVN